MAGLYGHIAMALLFALPAWILWDGRTGAAAVAFVVATATLPDLDLVLQDLGLPVEHHGVTHTVVFVVAFAAVAGLLAVAVLRPTLQRWWRLTEDGTVRTGTIYLFVAGGFALGGLSHLFADVLGGDNYEPLEPLWPVVETEVELGVARYTSPWLNGILLVVAVALHLAVLLSGGFPVEHRFRQWRADLSPERPPECPRPSRGEQPDPEAASHLRRKTNSRLAGETGLSTEQAGRGRSSASGSGGERDLKGE